MAAKKTNGKITPPKPSKKTDGKMEQKSSKAEPKNGKAELASAAEVWKSVLRLPIKTANRLKKAATKQGMSINAVLETIVDTWLKVENARD